MHLVSGGWACASGDQYGSDDQDHEAATADELSAVPGTVHQPVGVLDEVPVDQELLLHPGPTGLP